MDVKKKFEFLKKRSDITEAVRKFFLDKDFLQVETPVMASHVIPEAHIEIFKTEQISIYRKPQSLYLLPSPELWMKKLISQGSGSIFQICKSFRNNEQEGHQHSNEFTMLEYYACDCDCRYSLELTKELLMGLFKKFRPEYANLPVNVYTIRDAFFKTTGIDIEKCPDFQSMKEAAIKAGFDITDSYSTWEEVFNLLFINNTEPELCGRGITVLTDYPAQIPCMAKLRDDAPYYERWEMYIDGIEIANCYTEETCVEKVHLYYDSESRAKEQIAQVQVAVDPNYPEIFRTFPPCSGTAMGMDRLVMILTASKDIKDILAF